MLNRLAIIPLFLAGCTQQSLSPDTRPPGKSQMILELYPPPKNEPQIITDSPDAATVESTIRNQPWDEITFVVLAI